MQARGGSHAASSLMSVTFPVTVEYKCGGNVSNNVTIDIGDCLKLTFPVTVGISLGEMSQILSQ